MNTADRNNMLAADYLIYISESGDETCSITSGMAVPLYAWHDCFQKIREWRKQLHYIYGISIQKELHAYKFVAGRGRPSPKMLSKRIRANIFCDALRVCANLASLDVGLFNVFSGQGQALHCCTFLLDRIELFLSRGNGNAELIFDGGVGKDITALLRKMCIDYQIPSNFGGSNYTVAGCISDDPVFRDSQDSAFIQMVDFCAYSLLRHERPLARTDKYNLRNSFEILEPILMKKASTDNPYGIVVC